MIHDSAQVSPLAHVDGSAHIGANAVVEPFAFIGPKVHIGAGTWVGPNATVLGNTKVGQDCKLFPGCVVGADSQDLKYLKSGGRASKKCVPHSKKQTQKNDTSGQVQV